MLNWNHPNIPIFEAATEMASPRPETFGAGLMKTFKVHGLQRSGFEIWDFGIAAADDQTLASLVFVWAWGTGAA